MNAQQLDYFRPYINSAEDTKKRRPEDIHHIVPSSRNKDGRNWPTIVLYQDLHKAYHRVFGNALFQEALEQMLHINAPALSDKYKKDLIEVMQMQDEYVYKDGLYIKR